MVNDQYIAACSCCIAYVKAGCDTAATALLPYQRTSSVKADAVYARQLPFDSQNRHISALQQTTSAAVKSRHLITQWCPLAARCVICLNV
jgi:hypothetical protein